MQFNYILFTLWLWSCTTSNSNSKKGGCPQDGQSSYLKCNVNITTISIKLLKSQLHFPLRWHMGRVCHRHTQTHPHQNKSPKHSTTKIELGTIVTQVNHQAAVDIKRFEIIKCCVDLTQQDKSTYVTHQSTIRNNYMFWSDSRIYIQFMQIFVTITKCGQSTKDMTQTLIKHKTGFLANTYQVASHCVTNITNRRESIILFQYVGLVSLYCGPLNY